MAHVFRSPIAKYALWFFLLPALAMDIYGLWLVFGYQVQAPMLTKLLMVLGVSLKVGILACLLINKGPVKGLIYTWGGLFTFSGGTGLLSFAVSQEVEPMQAYLDKGLFLVIGVVLITIAHKQISYIENNKCLGQEVH